MGKTFAEKVLGRAAGYEVRANEVVTVEPDVCMSHDNGGPISRAFKKIGVEKVKYPERICFVLDHAIPAQVPRAHLLRARPRDTGTVERARGEP